MKTAVIYKSHYGSTETYARWLAEELSCDLLAADKVKPADLTRYETIIYGGGLYAGGVNGIALLTKNFELIRDKSLYLFTVGAADVTDPDNISSIQRSLKSKLPPEMLEILHLYHLRGGMQYSKMNLMHRSMMNLMVKMLRKKPENELTSDDRAMLSTFGQDVDFTDREAIRGIVADVKKSNQPLQYI